MVRGRDKGAKKAGEGGKDPTHQPASSSIARIDRTSAHAPSSGGTRRDAREDPPRGLALEEGALEVLPHSCGAPTRAPAHKRYLGERCTRKSERMVGSRKNREPKLCTRRRRKQRRRRRKDDEGCWAHPHGTALDVRPALASNGPGSIGLPRPEVDLHAATTTKQGQKMEM